ncbi:MAG: helix-turn-helix domain-containing protein [Treponema sp.]|jgi:transcriptional regulator with XRE-family HTH domain|nr:helix-turn-helix domain-containing protein [Treponema sp.]
MYNDEGIAVRFREVRATSGLKQKDFAASIGISHSVISDIERGAREPSRQVLSALAEVYHVDLNWLLLGVGKNEGIVPAQVKTTRLNTSEVEGLQQELEALKKNITDLERENKELSKELLDRMRQLLSLKMEPDLV